MLSEKLQKALNEQINKELFSEYLYLSITAYFHSIGLDGFDNWFEVQTKEEHDHAIKIYNFINQKGGRVILEAIAKPEWDFKSVEEILNKTLEHELFITKSINELVDIAIKENEHSVRSFLQWYVDEQVEEEANVTKLISTLKLTQGDPKALLLMDKDLATRVYVPLIVDKAN